MENFNSCKEAEGYLLKHATIEDWNIIVDSLNIAKVNAEQNLNPALFHSLSWPTNKISYIDYLGEFARWIPRESVDIAWRNPDTLNSQEVYDRLCHFYYLINQKTRNGIAQDIPWFSSFLAGYANVWGSFLDTPESFDENILYTFMNFSSQYRVQDSMINGKPNASWNCFNDFFARKLNSGLRPIDSPNDNRVITMPADCTFRQKYDIDQNSNIPKIIIKQTHAFANISELLKGSKYANSFANGTFVHYFLSPYSYHRFHVPVSGIVQECFPVHELTYLQVDISKEQFDVPDDAANGYEFSQSRGIITIDTTKSPEGDMGIIAVVPVGMCQVSSVHMTVKPESSVSKGDEFGHFRFGGSDIIILFQEGKSPAIDDCSKYRHYGSSMSKCPSDNP